MAKICWDTCHRCNGYGIVNGYQNDVRDCSYCKGSGQERARDSKGRFTTREVTAADHYMWGS